MKINYIISTLYMLLMSAGACKTDKNVSEISIGNWKAELFTEDSTRIPFTFLVEKDSLKYKWIINNAADRLTVDEITIEGDSVFIRMPFFDTELRLKNSANILEGVWIKHLANRDVTMKFRAEAGKENRFEQKDSATANITGRWDVVFVNNNNDTSAAVAEFIQNRNRVTGSFLTNTGDYRFLEGIMDANTLKLSTFDGSYAMLFMAELDSENNLVNGVYYSGYNKVRRWTARKNANAKLDDANKLTYLNEGYTTFDFSFPDLANNTVSLSDERFKNKVVVIQLLGSWCPNCIDETKYLSPYYDTMKNNGLEIVGLAYERKDDFKKAQEDLSRLINRLNINYTILFAGANTKENLSSTLPMLNQVMAFPTTIIIDKKGKIRNIHTGFSGPATGIHFVNYKKEFENLINQLINE